MAWEALYVLGRTLGCLWLPCLAKVSVQSWRTDKSQDKGSAVEDVAGRMQCFCASGGMGFSGLRQCARVLDSVFMLAVLLQHAGMRMRLPTILGPQTTT